MIAERAPALLADVGGTNTRLALADPQGQLSDVRILRNDAYGGMAEAVDAYLAEIMPSVPPSHGAFAVACPVIGDRVTLTNRAWSFSIADLQRHLRLHRLAVVNDFTAVALSVPRLPASDVVVVGGGRAEPDRPIAVIGPGTGLGVSGLVPYAGRWTALAAEGGHVTLPAASDREADIIRRLRASLGHVSAERAVSGPGLVNLYNALAEMIGAEPEALDAAAVTARAIARRCPISTAAVETFCEMLGTVAADLALSLGARGGVYIAGGIVPKLGELFLRSGFRRRFEDKGRFSSYLADIPTAVILAEVPAFRGLAALLEDDQPGIAMAVAG